MANAGSCEMFQILRKQSGYWLPDLGKRKLLLESVRFWRWNTLVSPHRCGAGVMRW